MCWSKARTRKQEKMLSCILKKSNVNNANNTDRVSNI